MQNINKNLNGKFTEKKEVKNMTIYRIIMIYTILFKANNISQHIFLRNFNISNYQLSRSYTIIHENCAIA